MKFTLCNFLVKGKIRSCRFRRIFTYTDDGLFLVRLGYVRVNDCPAGSWNLSTFGRNHPCQIMKGRYFSNFCYKVYSQKINNQIIFVRYKIMGKGARKWHENIMFLKILIWLVVVLTRYSFLMYRDEIQL